MAETIERNASPVRSIESNDDVNIALGSTEAGDQLKIARMKNQRSQSLMDAALSEFRYSVHVGDQIINISGLNLDLVRVCYDMQYYFFF